MTARIIKNARKIVIKFGSSTLADAAGRIDDALLASFAAAIATLKQNGKAIVVVSSGAQAAGLSTMQKWERKRDIHYRQALCAVGQVKLMQAWQSSFAAHGVNVAQILLTRDDFSDPIRSLYMRNTLFTLVDEGIIPIVNENDTVSVEEIKIGDNDSLAAQSAMLWNADLLVLFSDIDGLYDKNPHLFPDARFIGEVKDIAEVSKTIDTSGKSGFGTGGIVTKLDAASFAAGYGIPTIITRGYPSAFADLLSGAQRGTVFFEKT
ncbi:MAG: glutamate 5-kinase [Spirochaetaceae bacterium]|jgi:glutamate 5-kinase|nr:glutamate 5-kinase [Spirochaetaceae bacterium]